MTSDQNRYTSQSIYSRYWDHYVEKWYENFGEKHEWPGDEWGYSERWQYVYEKLFVPAGVKDWRRAVEIGPGSGKYTLKVLADSSATVRAFDISAKFLEVCEMRCQEYINQGRLSLHLLGTTRADQMSSELTARGWRRTVDAFYSIDAMVHVDLQYLIVYLITAGTTLKPGGKLILTVADATKEYGFEKLLQDIAVEYPNQGRSFGTSKFEWLSPDIVCSILSRLGFQIELLGGPERDLLLLASLTNPEMADTLHRYLLPQ